MNFVLFHINFILSTEIHIKNIGIHTIFPYL